MHPDFSHHVCCLHKALYGLKQASCAWFSRLSSRLLELGFVASQADTSLFVYASGHNLVYILVYVDDCIVTGSSSSLVQHFLTCLSADFPIKDLGDLYYFLGVEASHSSSGLWLSQQKYVHDLLCKTNMLLCKPVSFPRASSLHLSAFEGALFDDSTLY